MIAHFFSFSSKFFVTLNGSEFYVEMCHKRRYKKTKKCNLQLLEITKMLYN